MDSKRFDQFTKSMGHRLSRRSTLSAGAGLVGLTLAGSSVAPATAQEATPSPAGDGPAWLLLQRFAGATLSPEPDGASLLLEGLEPQVLAFTDHPARLVRSVPIAQAWSWVPDLADPPNATLLAVPVDGENEVAVVLELMVTSYDQTTEQLTATVRLLAEAPESGLQDLASPTALSETRRFGAGHLFIDDLGDIVPGVCPPCDQDPSYYQGRFQDCLTDGDGNNCNYCAGWAACAGPLDTGDPCGTVNAQCT